MLRYKFNPKILSQFFDYKVREMCKSCKRYGKKATCPPHIESLEYYKILFSKYKQGILLIEKFPIDNIRNWERLGKESSLVIQNELLITRKNLSYAGKFAIIFGAGSCKNCPACVFPCKYPEKSVIPIEGTGLNVIALAKKVVKIDIMFPVEKQKSFYRIGMILYD